MVKLFLTNSTGTIDISELVESFTWSGNYKDCARKLEFSYLSDLRDKNIPILNLNTGDLIRLEENKKELFRGYITNRSKSSSAISIKVTCFDAGIYINKNQEYYNFKGITPEAVTEKICKDFGINIGSIAKTGTKFDRKFFGASLYEIIMTSYSIASAKNKKKYMCLIKENKLNVIEKGTVKLKLKFENKQNIIDSEYSESIENMVNRVIVLDDKGKVVAKVENFNDIKKFGRFQKILKADEGKNNKALAQKELKGIEQTATLTGFGDTSCITGNAIIVRDNYSKLDGLFYIDEDVHTWSKGIYSIKLNLAFKNIMNEVNAGEEDKPDDNKNNSSTNNSSSDESSNGRNRGQAVIDEAKRHLGKRYVWGATGPNTFDCSGLTLYCYRKVGVNLPRTTWEQIKRGKSISKGNLRAGDLLFWNTDGSGTASHVGLYVGNGQFIHAPNSKSVVKYDSMNSAYYSSRYLGARRVI